MKHRRWKHWGKRHRRPNYQTAWQPSGVERLNPKIEELKQRIKIVPDEQKAPLLEKLLVLQAPRAALAQAQMDAHPRGYHNREKRLYELIDFNDAFVDCVLAEPHHARAGFAKRIRQVMARFCQAQDTPMFTDEQFEAIVHGLSREIAVYLGAQSQGLEVAMTSRAEDAFGIDMVVTDPRSRSSINVDIKTPSAFRYRLEELEKEGRITDAQLVEADGADFITVLNHRDRMKVPVTILCVRPERLGDVVDFRFQREAPLGDLLRAIIAKEGKRW